MAAFHKIRAYFTGYDYFPDEGADSGEPQGDDRKSIMETVVREKMNQQPEEQVSNVTGETTFDDLYQQHSPGAPTLSPLDSMGIGMPDMLPADRLNDSEMTDDMPEDTEGASEESMGGDLGEELEEGTQGEEAQGEEFEGEEQELEGRDLLGLDELFGDETGEAERYDKAVEEAAGWGKPEEGDVDLGSPVEDSGDFDDLGDLGEDGEAEDDEEEAKTFDDVEDLLPDTTEDFGEPEESDYGDRGFTKSILHAQEREAERAVRKVLAALGTNVVINIEGDDDDDVSFGDSALDDELGGDIDSDDSDDFDDSDSDDFDGENDSDDSDSDEKTDEFGDMEDFGDTDEDEVVDKGDDGLFDELDDMAESFGTPSGDEDHGIGAPGI